MAQEKDYVTKAREMFTFVCLINNWVTDGLSFLLLSIPATKLSKGINDLRFLFELNSSIILQVSSIPFDFSIKALETLKWFKPVLSRLLIKNWDFAS